MGREPDSSNFPAAVMNDLTWEFIWLCASVISKTCTTTSVEILRINSCGLRTLGFVDFIGGPKVCPPRAGRSFHCANQSLRLWY